MADAIPADPRNTEHLTGDALMYVNGRWTESVSGNWIDIVSPRNLQVIARVPRGSAEDVDLAVDAAGAAFPSWRATPARVRAECFRKAADAIEPHVERIARLSSIENGNALRTQTRGEAAFAVDCFRYFAGIAGELKGSTIPISESSLDYSRREPIGVVGAIVPWNAPIILSVLKIAPALVSGNSMVIKLAEDAPLAVLEIVRLIEDFLPPGVLNVLTGYGREAGEALIHHRGVAKLSFTGSTGVGRRVMQVASERIVPVSLELGGKSPQIVFPEVAHEPWVIRGVMDGMRFFRSGQSCTAGSRVLVHADVIDSFVESFISELDSLVVGDPLDEASDLGAIASQRQFDRVCEYIRDGIREDPDSLVLGGLPEGNGPLSRGLYVKPTVFAGVRNNWRIASEEIFGPVVCVIPWTDVAEAVAMANDTHYGLAGFVWTRDIAQGLRTAHALDAGWVQINKGGGQVLGQSYGGRKQSGFGREFSLEGMIDGYTTHKHVSVELGV
jgi:betaine-aldehyde dehydrogenase